MVLALNYQTHRANELQLQQFTHICYPSHGCTSVLQLGLPHKEASGVMNSILPCVAWAPRVRTGRVAMFLRIALSLWQPGVNAGVGVRSKWLGEIRNQLLRVRLLIEFDTACGRTVHHVNN